MPLRKTTFVVGRGIVVEHHRLALAQGFRPDAGLIDRIVAIKRRMAIGFERTPRPGHQLDRLFVFIDKVNEGNRAIRQFLCHLQATLHEARLVEHISDPWQLK